MTRKSIKNLILFTLVLLAFTFGYYRNLWGVVESKRFNDFDIYCESQVLGRVIRAEKEGIFSEGGLNGWVRDDSVMKDMTWDEMTYFQFDIYKKGVKIGPANFIIYDSQLGGQGMTFALIDKISPFSNSLNLYIFWLINSFSMAFLLTVFVSWVNKNYGFSASVITFLLLLISPWLTFFGRDLYLVLASFYLPFIVMLMLLYYEFKEKTKISLRKLFLLSTGLVFIKLFFSGFEFITTALVMFTVPLFYYMFLNRWKLQFFLKRFMTLCSGAMSAVIIYAILFSYQLSTLKGSFMYGFKYMLYCFLKRTHGNSADFPEGFKASLETNVKVVLKYYFDSKAIDFGMVGISFGILFYVLIVFSLLSMVPEKISPATYINRKRNIALVLTTWVSILGPMSWFIIFKAHSFIHLGFDDIVWYMPYCLFGFALIGSVATSLIKDINLYFESKDLVR
jgi:hypothetical protein